jgi:hypothetical protein
MMVVPGDVDDLDRFSERVIASVAARQHAPALRNVSGHHWQ